MFAVATVKPFKVKVAFLFWCTVSKKCSRCTVQTAIPFVSPSVFVQNTNIGDILQIAMTVRIVV